MAWLSNWSHRKTVTVTGQAGAGTNYQVDFSIGGASGGDFHLENHCTSFPNDIEVTDNDQTTIIDYWVEDLTVDPITMWAEVADDLGSNVDICFYYDKSGASSTSNGTNTFEFFDDFNINSDSNYEIKEDGAQDDFSYDGTNKRISVGSIRGRDGVSSYYLRNITQNVGRYISMKARLNAPTDSYDNLMGIWLSKEKGNVAQGSGTRTDFFVGLWTSQHASGNYEYERTEIGYHKDGAYTHDRQGNYDSNYQTHDREVLFELWATSGTMKGKITSLGAVFKTGIAEHNYSSSHTISLNDSNYIVWGDLYGHPSYANYTVVSAGWMDEFRVRKYVSPEPAYSSAGAEENAPSFVPYPHFSGMDGGIGEAMTGGIAR